MLGSIQVNPVGLETQQTRESSLARLFEVEKDLRFKGAL